MKICNQCGQEKNIPRGTLCAACIKKNQRAKLEKPVTNSPTESQTVAVTESVATAEDEPQALTQTLKLTKADKAWWKKNSHMGESWPNWSELRTTICDYCDKPFDTHLALLGTCANHG